MSPSPAEPARALPPATAPPGAEPATADQVAWRVGVALTGRTALLAALGAVVVALVAPSATGVVVVTVLVLAAAGVDAALAGPVGQLLVARSGDSRVRLGEAAVTRLAVTNPGRRRVRGPVRDAWPPSAGATPRRLVLDLPAGQRRVLSSTLVPTRRGDRHAVRVTVRSLGPLGLAARQGSRAVPGAVRALPAFTSRRHLPSRLARLRELDGASPVAVRGQGTEFDTLRAYVPGDDVRSIDWRGTARGGGVVVRTWRPERDRSVFVVLDCGRTSAGRLETGRGPTTRLDVLLDAALLLVVLAARAGDRVGFVALDRAVRARVRDPGRVRALAEVTAASTSVEPALVETDHRLLARTVLTAAPAGSLVVVLTGLDGPVVADGLVPALRPLLARHTVVVAAVTDPASAEVPAAEGGAGAADGVTGTVDGAYRAGAAARERLDRADAAALLERVGAVVVDAPPETVAPRLADVYLELKRTGRL